MLIGLDIRMNDDDNGDVRDKVMIQNGNNREIYTQPRYLGDAQTTLSPEIQKIILPKKETYGNIPNIKIQITSYQTPGIYQGQIVYTIYEN